MEEEDEYNVIYNIIIEFIMIFMKYISLKIP